MGIGLLGFIKAAAANIPWTKVAQSTPVLVDMLGMARAKLKLQETSQKNLGDQLKLLQEENARLVTDLQRMSGKLQLVTSRVSILTKLTAVSLLLALSSLVLWMLK